MVLMRPTITTRDKTSDGITVEMELGDEYVGFIMLGRNFRPGECEENVQALVDSEFRGRRPDVYYVSDVDVEKEFQGRGFGKALYLEALKLAAPAIIVPGACTGLGTSSDAMRVWKSLARKYKTLGRGSSMAMAVRTASREDRIAERVARSLVTRRYTAESLMKGLLFVPRGVKRNRGKVEDAIEQIERAVEAGSIRKPEWQIINTIFSIALEESGQNVMDEVDEIKEKKGGRPVSPWAPRDLSRYDMPKELWRVAAFAKKINRYRGLGKKELADWADGWIRLHMIMKRLKREMLVSGRPLRAYSYSGWGAWLTPDGRIIKVKSHGHPQAAAAELGVPDHLGVYKALEEGWVRLLYKPHFHIQWERINTKQKRMVFQMLKEADSDAYSFMRGSGWAEVTNWIDAVRKFRELT
jgi:GNAT superfamily N-acetyltransferase